MSGYLEEYGISDERHNRVVRWIVISVAAAGLLALAIYLTLPLAQGWWHVRAFVNDLRRHDYQAAYRDWGCATPCGDYSYQEFLKDWGPHSSFADASQAHVAIPRPIFDKCGGGVILRVSEPGARLTRLWYQPADGSLTFWPWEGCPSRIAAPATPELWGRL